MGRIVGRTPKMVRDGEKNSVSPYHIKADSGLDAAKAEGEGFHFTPFDDWFPGVVRETVTTGGKSPNSMDYFQQRAGSADRN